MCIRDRVYRDTSIVFIVYDVNNPSSLENVDFWLNEARNKLRDDCLYVLIANKIDLGCAIKKEEGLEFMKKNNFDFFYEISTKTGKNFDRTFKQIISKFGKETVESRKIKESIKNLKKSNQSINETHGYGYCSTSVSYTHLTLPTILLV